MGVVVEVGFGVEVGVDEIVRVGVKVFVGVNGIAVGVKVGEGMMLDVWVGKTEAAIVGFCKIFDETVGSFVVVGNATAILLFSCAGLFKKILYNE